MGTRSPGSIQCVSQERRSKSASEVCKKFNGDRSQDLQSTSEGGKRRRATSEKADVDQADGRRLRKDEVSRRMFFMSDGKPARFDWDKNTTYDPTRDEVKTFKYRTTLVTRYEGEEIIWNELEFFECAERVERK